MGATINGNTLIWPSGAVTQLWSRTDRSLAVILDAKEYTADLKDDGCLHWSDGDIWYRKAINDPPPASATMVFTKPDGQEVTLSFTSRPFGFIFANKLPVKVASVTQ